MSNRPVHLPEPIDAYPIDVMTSYIGRALAVLMAVVFPLAVGDGKYSNITAFKGSTFRLFFVAAALFMGAALILNLCTRPRVPMSRKYRSDMCAILGALSCVAPLLIYTGRLEFTAWDVIMLTVMTACQLVLFALSALYREKPRSLAALIEWALIAYALWMALSVIFARDPALAVMGRDLRNNGFIQQMAYISLWFLVSRFVRADGFTLATLVTGGTVFAAVCVLHNFGVDVYDVSSVVGEAYAGPFYDAETKFMGSMGNVNLGSYVISVMCILTGAAFVCGAKPKLTGLPFLAAVGTVAVCNAQTLGFWLAVIICVIAAAAYGINRLASSGRLDRLVDSGALLLAAFALMFFAELSMQTDAGYVALAVGLAGVCTVFFSSGARAARIFALLAAAVGAFALDKIIIDAILCGEGFGLVQTALLVVCAVLCVCAVFVRPAARRIGLRPSARAMRIAACCLLAAVIGGVVAGALAESRPSGTSAGALVATDEFVTIYDRWFKSDEVLEQVGQILRGFTDDSLGNNRMFTWKRSLEIFSDYPLLGIGPDNFKPVFAERYAEQASKVFVSTGGLDKAHNEFLDIMVSSGLPALLLMLAFLAMIMYRGIRRADSKPVFAVLAVAVLAYCAHAFFGYQLPLHSPIMWTIIGIAASSADDAAIL